MQKDLYSVLELTSTASDEQINFKYRALKQKYSEGRFLDGEAGNEAAKKLTELEQAYAEIMSMRSAKGSQSEETSYKNVEDALRANDLAKAQEVLDSYSERSAEWHYLQSVVFYKKNWINESKKQLEIAVRMDGTNQKYRDTLKNLEEKIKFNQQQAFTSGNANPQQEPERQMGGDPMTSCCSALLCANCLSTCCCR